MLEEWPTDICLWVCLFFVLQCRIPVQIKMEAACTSAALMAATLIATVKLATSWQMTGKPVKVNSIGMHLHCCSSELITYEKIQASTCRAWLTKQSHTVIFLRWSSHNFPFQFGLSISKIFLSTFGNKAWNLDIYIIWSTDKDYEMQLKAGSMSQLWLIPAHLKIKCKRWNFQFLSSLTKNMKERLCSCVQMDVWDARLRQW